MAFWRKKQPEHRVSLWSLPRYAFSIARRFFYVDFSDFFP
jgi:hypothetical protein